jgi:hypothetical protein
MTPQLHRRLTKIVAFLTALLGSALIIVSGEQVGSAEKWTAPTAEAKKKNPVAVTEFTRSGTKNLSEALRRLSRKDRKW